MPPRKSNASVVSTAIDNKEDGNGVDNSMHSVAATDTTPEKKSAASKDGLSVEDIGLPKTMVQRLSKGVLPANTQIQKDAQLAVWKSATVFINYLASQANENAMRTGKKTIQPKDVLDAISDLEFEFFLPRLDAEVTKYNDILCSKRNSYRKKVRDEAAAQKQADGNDDKHGPAPSSASNTKNSGLQNGSNATPSKLSKSTSAKDLSATRNGDTSGTFAPRASSGASTTEPAAKKRRRLLLLDGDGDDRMLDEGQEEDGVEAGEDGALDDDMEEEEEEVDDDDDEPADDDDEEEEEEDEEEEEEEQDDQEEDSEEQDSDEPTSAAAGTAARRRGGRASASAGAAAGAASASAAGAGTADHGLVVEVGGEEDEDSWRSRARQLDEAMLEDEEDSD